MDQDLITSSIRLAMSNAKNDPCKTREILTGMVENDPALKHALLEPYLREAVVKALSTEGRRLREAAWPGGVNPNIERSRLQREAHSRTVREVAERRFAELTGR